LNLRGSEKFWINIIPHLSRWAEAEAADLRDLSARLDLILRDAPKPISLDRPVRSVSDLSGDLLHQEISRLLPLFSDLTEAETQLDGALPRLADLIEAAKRAPVPFLNGSPLHEALRYERSRETLDRLVGLISDAGLGAAK